MLVVLKKKWLIKLEMKNMNPQKIGWKEMAVRLTMTVAPEACLLKVQHVVVHQKKLSMVNAVLPIEYTPIKMENGPAVQRPYAEMCVVHLRGNSVLAQRGKQVFVVSPVKNIPMKTGLWLVVKTGCWGL